MENERQVKRFHLFQCSYCGRMPALAKWNRYYTFGCLRCDKHILEGFQQGRFARRRCNTLEIAVDEWNFLNDLPGSASQEVEIWE